MIIKASQRGGANKLSAHLLNEQDNEHVEIHRVSGFISNNLAEALEESYAISRGTKCKQHLFSVSLSPPQDADVPISVFEDAASRIEKAMQLEGQPHVMLFHEKEGRRHAHVVWSRIDSNTMTAVNLPFFKNKMNDIARDLFLDYGWDLPKGFVDKEMSNPLNYTLAEFQQAKRLNDNPKIIKLAIQDSWKSSNTKTEFETSLEKNGFYLARGDRRGFVVVDWRGEVYSLSRMAGVKKPALINKLGDEKDLPSVTDTRNKIDQKLVFKVQEYTQTIQSKYKAMMSPVIAQRSRVKAKHKSERQSLRDKQTVEQKEMALTHQARFNKGLFALWDRFIGKHGKIRKQNEKDAKAFELKAQKERENLIAEQLKKRRHIQQVIKNYHRNLDIELVEMRENVFSKLEIDRLSDDFERLAQQTYEEIGLDL